MKKLNSFQVFFITCSIVSILVANSAPAGPIYPGGEPDWADDPAATRASYNFPSDSTNPSPTDYDNQFGTPQAEVVWSDEYGTGWQDPETDDYTRGNEGAWDLGKGSNGGSFSVDSPIDYPAGDDVKVHVYTIFYDFVGDNLPGISVAGLTATDVSESDEFFESDDGPGSWRSLTWSGTVSPGDANSLSVNVNAHQENGTLIDGADVYAVPEPSSLLLLLFAGVMVFAFYRGRAGREWCCR